ncbi:MAG: DUF721 domain-containing protein [Candidatus Zixiibacteriota bacterium]
MQSIANILRKALARNKFREETTEFDIAANYEKLFPGIISQMSKPVRVNDDVLYIKVFDCVLRNELKFRQNVMLNKINEKMRIKKLRNIKFI